MMVERLLWAVLAMAAMAQVAATLRPVSMRHVLPLAPAVLFLGLLRPMAVAAAPGPPAVRLVEPSPEPRSGSLPGEGRDLESPAGVDEVDGDEPGPRHETYRVQPGDSLWAIACRESSTTTTEEINRRWRQIYEANRDTIGDNPDLIHPGQVLLIPEVPGA